MVLPADGFALGLVVTAVVVVLSAGLAWRKRDEPGGLPLVVFQLALTIGLLGYAYDIESTTLSTQRVLASIWLVAQAATATTWVYVAIEYSGLERWANRKTALALAAEPLLLATVLVTPLREYMFTLPERGVEGSLIQVGIETEPLFFIHFGALFVIMLTGSLLLVRLFLRSRHLYRTQATAVAVAAIAPWVTFFTGAFLDFFQEDPSVIAWSVAGIALTLGLYRFKTLDPVPAAQQTVVEQMGDGVVILDDDDVISDCNPAAEQFLTAETNDEPMVGRPVAELFEDWAQVEYPEDGTTAWQELALEVDGDDRYVEVQVSPFADRFDRVVGRLVVLRDVTDRTRRERKLARFKTIFESVTDRVYVLDRHNRFLLVNEPFASLVGYEAETLDGEPFETVLTEPDARSIQAAESPDESSFEVTIETADGDTIPCETRRAPISFDGDETGVVGILRDISRWKAVEASLEETTQQLETLVEASPIAIIGTNPDGEIEVWNDAAEEMFGWSESAVTGSFPPISSGERREELQSLYDRAAAGEEITDHEMELDRNDGGRLDASVSLAPVTSEPGQVYGTVAVIVDISERKERERTLKRRNERLDEFASLVSHDLRNPLQVAQTRIEIVMNADDEETRAESLTEAMSALDRMGALIDDSLTLAREGRDMSDPRPITLERVAERAWGNVDTANATLEIALGDLSPVRGDPSRVAELFENLFRNAIEHGTPEDQSAPPAGDGNEPWDSDRGVGDQQAADASSAGFNDDAVLTVRVERFDGGFAVEDDGTGLPDTGSDELLEAGYTTDEDGTGFGLAIVDRIAEAHGWELSVTEGAEGGARFEFEIGE